MILPIPSPLARALHRIFALTLFAAFPLAPRAETAREAFDARVQPILTAHCAGCHGAAKQKSELRLDSFDALVRGGLGGPIIVPGAATDSRLLQAINYSDDLKMPPKEQLAPADIAVITDWVKSLATADLATASGSDAPAQNLDAEKYWAFHPVMRTVPPTPRAEGGFANPIDNFIVARLAAEGLAPAPPADPATLARRLFLDVTGIPPEPSVVRDYLAAPTDAAWSALVDSALNSPRYGERWARHWLDLVRFAETNGFEMNGPRKNAWPYRDYVIRAFNADKPYDRFVFEQLAGDQTDEPAATGFLVAGTWDEVKSPDRELTLTQRANELHDMVSTTGAAFLGLTVGCARCHNHKFDPISQRDYYAMTAIVAGVLHGERELPDPNAKEHEAKAQAMGSVLAKLDAELAKYDLPAQPQSATARRSGVNAALNSDRFEPMKAKGIRFTIEKTNSGEPCLDELVVFSTDDSPPSNVALASRGGVATASGTFPGSTLHKLEHINDGKFGNDRSWISNEPGRGWIEIQWPEARSVDRVVWARDRNRMYADRLATAYKIEALREDGAWTLVADSTDRAEPGAMAPGAVNMQWLELQMVRTELNKRVNDLKRGPRAYAGTFAEPEPTHILQRGDPMQPAEEVVPGGVAALSPPLALPAAMPERERRAALARWIASPENPLTARVMVNRIWHYIFGQGLVVTPSDFGAMGARPSHPELLDTLAADFMDHGWSIKYIARMILNSRTYRQSSRPDPKAIAVDAGSRLLWRFPPRRLEAEPIRDSILWVTGALDLGMGGPGYEVFEPNDNYVRVYTPKTNFTPKEWRRMVYQTKPRNQSDSTFGVFDCPEGAQPMPRRAASTTPLQALNLMNSPFIIQQAALFARRLDAECGTQGLEAEVRRAFELAYGRPAEADEITASAALARTHGLPVLCRAIFNSNEFLRIE